MSPPQHFYAAVTCPATKLKSPVAFLFSQALKYNLFFDNLVAEQPLFMGPAGDYLEFRMISPVSNVSSHNNETSTNADANLTTTLTELSVRWSGQTQQDLELRFYTGKKLNELIGEPSMRSKYGTGVVKEASTLLKIPKPDIYRMRCFADLFTSYADFYSAHPDLKNWTQVKVFLAATRKTADTPDAQCASPNITKILGRNLKTFAAKLTGVQTTPDDLVQLKPELDIVVKALHESFGLVLQLIDQNNQ